MRNNFIVAIPSKGRAERLNKFLNLHYDDRIDYLVSVERQEANNYINATQQFSNVKLLFIDNNNGCGYARRMLYTESYNLGYEFTFFTDDNIRLKGDIFKFVDIIKNNKKIHWLGAFNSIYDLFYKNHKRENLFEAEKTASVVFCVRNENIKIINFDDNCIRHNDDDFNLELRKIYHPENPIYVSKVLEFQKKRHYDGGCKSWKSVEETLKIFNYFKNKHGDYFVLKKCQTDFKIKWQKFKKDLQ